MALNQLYELWCPLVNNRAGKINFCTIDSKESFVSILCNYRIPWVHCFCHALNIQDPSHISKDAAKLANSNKEKQTSPKKNASFIFEDVVVPMLGE